MLCALPQLDRVAVQLGLFHVYWDGIIIGTGVLLGLWLATREGERRGIPKDTFVDLVLIAVPIAILFARMYYVIFGWEYYAQNPSQIISIRHGGLAIHGGLIGAVVTGILFAKRRGGSLWKCAD
ncbi:prolipoprotein diacylglyceryl transferase family protein, partial [Bacillus sp. S1-R5C1-FB]|uniref:prolipoprotein diacylglyceryl transferase family protein n=1 Tax=Bacillus sp. S1-R5C1-FB TaxID=1973491 RepID=UPI0015C505A4